MNPIAWVEVPVSDMSRAIAFYNAVFGWNLEVMEMGDFHMAMMPWEQGAPNAAGALVQNAHYTPSQDGSVVYFGCEDVAVEAGRIESAGGKLLQGKTQISPEYGYMALAIDSEGNRIALHSGQ